MAETQKTQKTTPVISGGTIDDATRKDVLRGAYVVREGLTTSFDNAITQARKALDKIVADARTHALDLPSTRALAQSLGGTGFDFNASYQLVLVRQAEAIRLGSGEDVESTPVKIAAPVAPTTPAKPVAASKPVTATSTPASGPPALDASKDAVLEYLKTCGDLRTTNIDQLRARAATTGVDVSSFGARKGDLLVHLYRAGVDVAAEFFGAPPVQASPAQASPMYRTGSPVEVTEVRVDADGSVQNDDVETAPESDANAETEAETPFVEAAEAGNQDEVVSGDLPAENNSAPDSLTTPAPVRIEGTEGTEPSKTTNDLNTESVLNATLEALQSFGRPTPPAEVPVDADGNVSIESVSVRIAPAPVRFTLSELINRQLGDDDADNA